MFIFIFSGLLYSSSDTHETDSVKFESKAE